MEGFSLAFVSPSQFSRTLASTADKHAPALWKSGAMNLSVKLRQTVRRGAGPSRGFGLRASPPKYVRS
uniref:Uncharacterized protein n=1 Tax=Anguilla anguilla TaxID=7936 RepID=A0A0E9UFB8_ANGAN